MGRMKSQQFRAVIADSCFSTGFYVFRNTAKKTQNIIGFIVSYVTSRTSTAAIT